MKNIFSLEGKVAVITGGSGHLGKVMVQAVADYGATTVVLDRQPIAPEQLSLDDAARQRIHWLECDLSETDSIKASFAKVWEQFERLDSLVNCAAYGGGAGGSKVSNPVLPDDESWISGLEGTVTVTYRCIRESAPYLKKNGGGTIVSIASMYGHIAPDPAMYGDTGWDSPAMYGAGKAGVLQLTRYFASNLAADNIRVNAITPGPFPQPTVEQHAEFHQRLIAKTMMGRYGKAEELTGALLLLTSDASSYMTGSNITVDGGWTAW
jgi:NAD(P)-dependent dehydrogenase (short-subunit alcohol dehydrogenase family)